MNNELVKVNNKGLDIFDDPNVFLNKLTNLQTIADVIATSEVYGKLFKTSKKDASGNIMKDDNGEIIEEVSKSDIVCCIGLGKEMGLDVFGSLTFGKALNADSYKKVMRGKSLGLDPMASLNMVNIIPTGNGDIIHTGVHVITNSLNKAGIRYEFICDFQPIKLYPVLTSNLDVSGVFIEEDEYTKNSEKYLMVTPKSKADELNLAIESGISVVKPPIISRKTTVKFMRNNYPDLYITYTLQEAIDAELYKGVTSQGTKTSGKANWNNNPSTMLRNRTITIGGRIIGSDIIHNTYSTEEVSIIAKESGIRLDNIEEAKAEE